MQNANNNKNANGLFNVAALGVVTQSPEPELAIRRSTTQILAGKLIFVEGGKLEVRLRSTNHSPRTSPGSNLGRSGESNGL